MIEFSDCHIFLGINFTVSVFVPQFYAQAGELYTLFSMTVAHLIPPRQRTTPSPPPPPTNTPPSISPPFSRTDLHKQKTWDKTPLVTTKRKVHPERQRTPTHPNTIVCMIDYKKNKCNDICIQKEIGTRRCYAGTEEHWIYALNAP